jgi:serine/threonine-protein kinase
VYRAEQPKLKRTVVVKVLNETQQHDQRAVERFLREAQLASQLDHRYAAHVYDSGISDDGLLWIVMEYVPGISLQRWLAKHGPMPFETFVPFFERVAQVVQAAHKRGIVHRDLKPSNVMVMEEDGQLWPKLLDFGIAKRADAVDNGVEDFDVGNEVVALLIRSTPQPRLSDRTTKPNSVVPARRRQLTRPGGMGSLAYMSPEQWDNAYAVGPAADIYSLGVVVYESLTGRVPFAAADAKELYDLHLLASVPLLGGDVPPEVNRTVRRALAKRPEDRHASVIG